MNYFEIGQRIRRIRKAKNLSQEQLAEKIGISTTHMSHIETGNTKLSLPVFVAIAEVLCVQTDELLHDSPQLNNIDIKNEITTFLDSCSQNDAYFILDISKACKIALDKQKNPEKSF